MPALLVGRALLESVQHRAITNAVEFAETHAFALASLSNRFAVSRDFSTAGIAGHPMPAQCGPNSNGGLRDMKPTPPLETCPVPAISHAPPPPEGVKITKVLNNHLPSMLQKKGSAPSGPFSGPFLRVRQRDRRPSDVRIVNGKNAQERTEENGSSKPKQVSFALSQQSIPHRRESLLEI